MPRKKHFDAVLRPRFRVTLNGAIALGPGKIELLRSIERTGSIAQSAKKLEMSYMRAWSLVKTMNASFEKPVIEAVRGGQTRGGAILTTTGREALDLYEKMADDALIATQNSWARLKQLLRK